MKDWSVDKNVVTVDKAAEGKALLLLNTASQTDF